MESFCTCGEIPRSHASTASGEAILGSPAAPSDATRIRSTHGALVPTVGRMNRAPRAADLDGWVAQLSKPSRRQQAKVHLRAAGQPAVPAVRRGLHNPDPMVRRLCASILDHLADELAFVDLVAALDDEDPDVLKRALHALACDRCKENGCRPGEELFVPRALELLHHPNADIRASAIDTLGKVAARRPDVAIALAEVARRDRDSGLRGMARRRVATRGQTTTGAARG